MHKRLMATILMTLVAGCTGKTDKSNSQSASADSSAPAAATSPGDWTIEKTTSGIDGETVTASKSFPFPDRNTEFLVSVTCATGNHTPGMSIESYVGDQKNPDARSAFAAQSSNNDGLVGGPQPTGRMKIGSDEATTLDLTFHVDPSYSNKMIMNRMFMTPIEGISTESTLRFPMVLELTNGVGVFELDINASNEVNQVLVACASALKEDTAAKEQAHKDFQAKVDAENASAPTAQQAAATAANSVRNPGAIRDTFSGEKTTSVTPSFDCKLASEFVETLICTDNTLARLDNALDSNYKTMMAADIGDDSRKTLASTEQAWLMKRNQCTDEACLNSSYRYRINAVCAYPAIDGNQPKCTFSEQIK